ncbi:DUF4817 domain-containing protein [Trichonephila clavipes]|nr:DUF4817 domain-containing protein [Trichonephila clavipes]
MQMKVCTVLSGVTAQKKVSNQRKTEISVVTAVSEFNFGSLFTLKHVHQNASLPSMQISGVRDERRLKQSRNEQTVGGATLPEERMYPLYWLQGIGKTTRKLWLLLDQLVKTDSRVRVSDEARESLNLISQQGTLQTGVAFSWSRATIDLLKDTFGDRLISRFVPVNWPPRSCDLTPLDNFLWSYVKSLVHADKPQTLDHLEDNIRRVIADIRPQMLEKVIENWTSRLDYIRARRCSPMPEIIFKICCCGALMCNHPASATQGLYRAHSVHSQASSQASADEHWSPLRHTASNPTDAFGTIEFQGSAHPLKAQNIAIRIHFHHYVNDNMLPEPRIFHWVVPECKVTVIV